ncbi:MAG: site-specific integrase [Bdellovibrionota bacterium]
MGNLLIDDYAINGRKSLKRAKEGLANLKEFFGPTHALDLTTDRINGYIRWRLESRQPATVQYELRILKRMFTLGERAGKVGTRPYIPSIEVNNTRTGFFEENEFKALLSHLPEELHGAMEFAYLTGWRRQEVFSLEWRRVDFKAGVVRLEPGSTKNREGRVFPFGVLPPLQKVLEKQEKYTRQVEIKLGKVIPQVFHREGIPIMEFRDPWEEACTKANIPGKLFHDFRRTAVRNLERAGVPRSVAMKLTGHKTESVYRRYAIVCEADLSEGIKKLAAWRENQPQEAQKVIALGEKRSDAEVAQLEEKRVSLRRGIKPRSVLNQRNSRGKTGGPGGTRTHDQRIMSPPPGGGAGDGADGGNG